MQEGRTHNTMHEEHIVQMAKQRFEHEVHTDAYKTVHADANHLESLLNMMEIQEGKSYLDIGTGNGYLAFELATRYPHITVTGVDITDRAMVTNTQIAREKNLTNVHFDTYQGITFPFHDASFFGIISRYALHHFPKIEVSVTEMYRMVEPHGVVILADPLTYEADTVRFVDQFQALKRDGHVCFYQTTELIDFFENAGFMTEKHFLTQVTYSRELNAEYTTLFDNTPSDMLKRYHITIQGEQVFITVRVFNVMFRKPA